MGKLISAVTLSDTLSLSVQTDGIWLWDETRQMNLAMKAETTTDALVEALHYYQNRLIEVEQKYADLSTKVDAFVSQFTEEQA